MSLLSLPDDSSRSEAQTFEIRGVRVKIEKGILLWYCEKYRGFFSPRSCASFKEKAKKDAYRYHHCYYCSRLSDELLAAEIRRIGEMSEKNICEVCGKEFEPFRWGSTIVKRKCEECMKKSLSGKRRGKENAAEKRPSVTVSFANHEDVLKWLEQKAREEVRTLSQQVVWYLKKAMEEENGKAED